MDGITILNKTSVPIILSILLQVHQMMLKAKDTMMDMNKESMMEGTGIVTDMVTMIPLTIMTIMKLDIKKAMKRVMMKAIVKDGLNMRKRKKMRTSNHMYV